MPMILGGLAVISLVMGIFLLFSFATFQQISHFMNRPIFSEAWIHDHRKALGILLSGLAVVLFVCVYIMMH